jgi:alkylation response protein AidB-like acyl-CoA dehydrogenase
MNSFIELAGRKSPALGSKLLKDNNAIQQSVGYNYAKLQSARAALHQTTVEMWNALHASNACSADQRLHLRMISTFAIQQAREVAQYAYHAAGSTAIFNSQPFEQRFRDINSVTQQGQSHMSNFEPVGEALMTF